MQPEDMSGGTPQQARKVERVLIVRPIADSMMAETNLLEGGGNDIGLGDYIEERYREDWRVVSHDYTQSQEGRWILSVLMERPKAE